MKKKENKKTTEDTSLNDQAGKGKRKIETGKSKPEVSKKLPEASPKLPLKTGLTGRAATVKENSTVFLTIKPFIKGTFLFAEGNISESQTVRTWMMIRIYNN